MLDDEPQRDSSAVMISLPTLLIVLPGVFLGGLIDSIAGGGGLISLPAYLAAGLPTHVALGNNKFSSCFGTLFATWRYLRWGWIARGVALTAAAAALLGSYAGARTVLWIDPGFLRLLLLVLIPLIAAFTLGNRRLGGENRLNTVPTGKRYALSVLAGLSIGFYDGFFGPGTGTFLILFFTIALKCDFVTANANTKVINLASNVAALVGFLGAGKVVISLGIPAALAGIAGNLLGARLVRWRGNRIIRPLILVALSLLLVKVVFDLLRRM